MSLSLIVAHVTIVTMVIRPVAVSMVIMPVVVTMVIMPVVVTMVIMPVVVTVVISVSIVIIVIIVVVTKYATKMRRVSKSVRIFLFFISEYGMSQSTNSTNCVMSNS